MPRIRSIKPEFWTDGKNLALSDSCALFFIGLWNFCDDEGTHRLDLMQVCAELGGRWRRDKVSLFLLCLAKSGQIRVSSCAEWMQIISWFHQKIDKPKQPSVKAADLQWLDAAGSAKALEQSRGVDARIGEDRRDRRGEDLFPTGSQATAVAPSKPSPPKPKAEPPTNATWAKYSSAYQRRYREPPVRNKTVNGQLGHFVSRLGADEAPLVAEFYLTHNRKLYVEAGHSVGLMLMDAEKLRTEWATGQKITASAAHQVDRTQTTFDAADRAWDQVQARKAQGGANAQ